MTTSILLKGITKEVNDEIRKEQIRLEHEEGKKLKKPVVVVEILKSWAEMTKNKRDASKG